MPDFVALPGKLSNEGRATIPASVRQLLGLRPGDRLAFLLEGTDVRIVSARQLAIELWTNNHGGDAGDSAEDVRGLREADRQAEQDSLARIEAHVATLDQADDAEVTAGLLTAMGFES